MKDKFTEIYKTNFWSNPDSVSGHGSDLLATEIIRQEIPLLIEQYEIGTMLDIPCGDYWWFSHMKGLDGVTYTGADIVDDLIAENRRIYPRVNFQVLDLVEGRLPKVDLVLVRDCLGHLSNKSVRLALKNLRASGSKYLLATTFPDRENGGDIQDGEWRPINLASFFGLPDPIEYINEGCTVADGKFADKSLGLWRIN